MEVVIYPRGKNKIRFPNRFAIPIIPIPLIADCKYSAIVVKGTKLKLCAPEFVSLNIVILKSTTRYIINKTAKMIGSALYLALLIKNPPTRKMFYGPSMTRQSVLTL
jgi:hypothetical protein